jgi:hypothetical protein
MRGRSSRGDASEMPEPYPAHTISVLPDEEDDGGRHRLRQRAPPLPSSALREDAGVLSTESPVLAAIVTA